MATFSKKMGGKEVGQASVYAKPHTMSGDSVSITKVAAGKRTTANDMNMSVGNISRSGNDAVKTSGVVTRGNGAATKGTKARGPMA